MSIVRERKAAAVKYKYPCQVCGKRAKAAHQKIACSEACCHAMEDDALRDYVQEILAVGDQAGRDACWPLPEGLNPWYCYRNRFFGSVAILIWVALTEPDKLATCNLFPTRSLEHSCGDDECLNYWHMFEQRTKTVTTVKNVTLADKFREMNLDDGERFSVKNLAEMVEVGEDVILKMISARSLKRHPGREEKLNRAQFLKPGQKQCAYCYNGIDQGEYCGPKCQNRHYDKCKSAFWHSVKIGGPDDCWPWVGDNKFAPSTFVLMGRRMSVQEAAYRCESGDLISPSGISITSCNNPICCNVRHIRLLSIFAEFPATDSANVNN